LPPDCRQTAPPIRRIDATRAPTYSSPMGIRRLFFLILIGIVVAIIVRIQAGAG
tara:strand:- start:5613 stop:5774 length:162 start_codon:yes stop_codon:yes gene_type:complete